MPRRSKETTYPTGGDERVSEHTISRMRWYLYVLEDYATRGIPVITSREISEKVGMKSGLVRKDLCQFGGFGRPSVGYNVTYLQRKLREILRISEPRKIAWVGADPFASDPDRAEKFAGRNCIISAVFDSRPEWVGKQVGRFTVQSTDEIEETAKKLGFRAAIITSSGEDTPEVVEKLAAGGVKAIVNVSPKVVAAPPGVSLRNIDVAGELLLLCYFAVGSQESDEGDIIPQGEKGSQEQ
jgi:redox-sensing transcriptional repressor